MTALALDPLFSHLHAVTVREAERLEAEGDVFELLATVDATLEALEPGLRHKLGAWDGTVAQPRTPFPVLRLAYVPSWSGHAALGPESRVLLQGRGDRLHLRILGGEAPQRVVLRVRHDKVLRASVGALRPRARSYALPHLNGDGRLWLLPDLHPAEVLGSSGATLRLEVDGERLPAFRLPRVPDEVRATMLEAGTGKVQDLLRAAIRAYLQGHAEGFAKALDGSVRRDGQRDPGLLVANGEDRPLSLWQALWLAAMAAEIHAADRAAFYRFGCHRMLGHAQLQPHLAHLS